MAGVSREVYEEKRARIVQMLEEGATCNEIKEAIGYKSCCQIYRVRDEICGKREKATWHRENYKYEKHDDEVIRMRKEGATYKEIASFFGYKSETSVEHILRKHGLINDASEREDRNKKIIEARKNGKSMACIADSLGLTLACVSSVCRSNGVGGKLADDIDYGYGVCELCGAKFKRKSKNQKFCSTQCRKRTHWKKFDPLRHRLYQGAIVDRDITLHKLYRLSDGICYLCGGKCDWSDTVTINGRQYSRAKYPSIDHVVPLIKGGEHSWNNVRLAHLGCNSSKGAK